MLVVGQRTGTVRFYGTTKFAPGKLPASEVASAGPLLFLSFLYNACPGFDLVQGLTF